MRIIILLFIVFGSLFTISAQENLLSLINNEEDPVYEAYLFKGTKVVNAQSVEMASEGVLQFNIQHRFGPINSGSYNLYGLDFSRVRLSLDYGITEWFLVSLGRSSSLKTIDASSKIRFARQVKNRFPVMIVSNSAIYFKQYIYNDSQVIFTDRLSFLHQVLFARKINRELTIQISPTFLHYNLNQIKNDVNDRYAIGFGGRQKLSNRVSLNVEYFIQLNNKINNNVLSLGFDIETGGHVFQLHISNSPEMIDPEFITKTDGDWLNGDIYFGFNISRVFLIN